MTRLSERIDLHRPIVPLITALEEDPNFLNDSAAVTSGSSASTLDRTVYRHNITTGGTAGSEDANLGDGTGATIGERHLIYLETRTNASDVVNLDHANFVNEFGVVLTNLDLDAADEYVLAEWTGSAWKVISHNATVAPTDESVQVTTGASPTNLDISVERHIVTTGGTGGSEDLNVGDGTGASVGQIVYVEIGTLADPSDVVNMDHANIHSDVAGTNTATNNVDLDAAGEFIYMQWTGSEWLILYSDATVSNP